MKDILCSSSVLSPLCSPTTPPTGLPGQLRVKVREMAKRRGRNAYLRGLAGLATSDVRKYSPRPARPTISSQLHLSTPRLSSAHRRNRTFWPPVPDVLRNTHVVPSSALSRRYQCDVGSEIRRWVCGLEGICILRPSPFLWLLQEVHVATQ
jgi:hypothetical protein